LPALPVNTPLRAAWVHDFNTLTAARILKDPKAGVFQLQKDIRVRNGGWSFSSGVRRQIGGCCRVRRPRPRQSASQHRTRHRSNPRNRSSGHTRRARLFEHMVRRSQILRSDPERLVQGDIGRRLRPLAFHSPLRRSRQNVVRRDGAGLQGSQVFPASLTVDSDNRRRTTSPGRRIDLGGAGDAGTDHIEVRTGAATLRGEWVRAPWSPCK